MTNKANSKPSFLRRNLKSCPEKLKQTAYFFWFALLWSMAPLFGTHTKNTTVTKLRGCSDELQGSSKVGIRDTLVFLICLMCWGGRPFLKGDKRLDLFCLTKLLTVWHKCPSKASLSRRIRVLPDSKLLAVRRWPTGGSASGPLEICPSGSPEDRRWQPR